jgi:hypothetical protein
MSAQPDCCARPSLRILEAIPDEMNAQASVQRCVNCSAYWQVDAEQVITDRGEIIAWDWFVPLSEGEAEDVLAHMEPR